jgi:phosphoenolpyruvate-protein kinase (PTS system EI component)
MTIYKGETVADGVALGHVHLEGYENAQGYPRRISSDQVEEELNRLRDALAQSRAQIEELKSKHKGNLGAHELRIFDAQVGYLQDTKFINEIETLVMEERLSARASIHRVVDSYDRIFQLVENDHLRQRAVDLRDVATRVLRNLRDDAREVHAEAPSGRYILAARKLVTTDMFNLDNEQVEGIVAEKVASARTPRSWLAPWGSRRSPGSGTCPASWSTALLSSSMRARASYTSTRTRGCGASTPSRHRRSSRCRCRRRTVSTSPATVIRSA